MIQQIFELRPFPGSNAPTNLRVTTRIERQSNLLTLRYSLKDSSSQVAIPPRVDPPQRKNNLWEETCFEFFVAKKPGLSDKPGFSTGYWEFNFAPSRHWNVYHFDSYRQGMKEESAFSHLPIDVSRIEDLLWLQAKIPLGKLRLGDLKIQIGITAVVKTKDGNVSYWARAHCGQQPDFHLRESFLAGF